MFSIAICFFQTSFAANEVIPTGSKIINMGASSQTVANGLKPYGLVYALLKANIPVKWIINPNKIKDGIDFTHNSINYKGSAFIIPAQYLTTSVNSIITTWISKGVLVNTTVSPITVYVAYTLNSPPRWVMDATTGYIAVGFLKSAEIPTTAYIFKAPSQLNTCDDIYVMPHAVPTWATHSNLYYWNLNDKGAIWSGCHAASNMENSSGTDAATGTTKRMNFLMSDGPAPTQNAVPFNLHNPGTPAYNLQYPTNPVMQFLGKTDNAHTWGYETVYMPNKSGSWRPTTLIGSYDPSQQDIPAKSNGMAAAIAFGRGFGDNTRGWVMYEAGHDISGVNQPNGVANQADNVAAQRAFFNFSYISAIDKQPAIAVTTSSNVLVTARVYNLTAVASSPVGSSLSYQWSSSIGGTFSNPNSAATTWTAPNIGSTTTCIITCKVTDNCGRISFDTKGLTTPNAPVCANDVAQVPSCSGNVTTINVLANDSNPDGGPLTVSLIGSGTNGTFTNAGNGIIQYVPNSNFYSGSDVVTYQVCNATGQCCTSTITVTTALTSSNGCNSSQYWGVDSNMTAVSGVGSGTTPPNAAEILKSLGHPDGEAAVATTYTTFAAGVANTVTYTLSDQVRPVGGGTLKLYVDALTAAKTFTLQQSPDNSTWSAVSSIYSVALTDDFLESTVKSYALSKDAKYIRVISPNTSGSLLLDAITVEVYNCLSASITATNDAVSVFEDMPVTIDVLTNDIDPQNQQLIITGITSAPTKGKVSINTDNTITYLNTKDISGVDNFSYRVSNATGQSSTATVTVTITDDGTAANTYKAATTTNTTINPVNTDSYIKEAAPTGTSGSTADIRVRGRTTLRERALLKFDITTLPAGALIDSASLSLYHVANAGGENVSVYRNSTRDFVEASVAWNYYTGTTVWTTPGGDFDAATVWANKNIGTSIAARKTWNLTSLVQAWKSATYTNYGIMVKRNVESTTGYFKEMRFTSYNGTAANRPTLYVRYKTTPGAAVAIPSYAPLAMPDTTLTSAATAVTVDVTANDFNYNAGSLTISLSRATSRRGGTVAIASNQIVYTPPTSYVNGVDTLTYIVANSGLYDSANVYITLNNTAPNANADVYTITSNTSILSSSSVNTVTSNDADPEGSSLTGLTITLSPGHGDATVSGDQITYTPDLNYIGNDTLIYQVSESVGSGCTLLSDTALIVYIMTNRAPIAVADADTTNPCLSKIISVLRNDYDPEGGNLTIEIVTQPSLGVADTINNGTEIRYTPPAGSSGVSTSFTYRIKDNATPPVYSSTVTVTIYIRPAPTNGAPVALRDTFHIFLNDVLYADVLRNDSDPDNNTLISPLTILTNGTHGTAVPDSNGLIKYTPTLNYVGTDSFYYRVYDDVTATSGGGCVSAGQKSADAWVYIIIQEVPTANRNYLAVMVNTSGNAAVIPNDIFGVDGPATGTIVITIPPVHGNVSVLAGSSPNESDDQVRYTPNIGFTGQDSLVYQICDSNGDCDTAIVYIMVKADTDGDGIPDDIDIDDDNDGITDIIEVCGNGATGFNCSPISTDPASDDDQDGLVNWKDANYGTLNSRGCVATLDSDSDGVPDFLDLDSDNDGIPDVVEALGADSDGDGIIDYLCDTDYDGLSQNVDANNTGDTGSGNGLGFVDFDGDGIPNSKDVDSDNDGIPDLVESYGTDANNDGTVDDVTDSDGDGWADTYDGDADGDWYVENDAAVLILTGTDGQYVDCATPGDGRPECYTSMANADNQGLPNFLDLDSDGDGITDFKESGISGVSTTRSMITGCTSYHGWCATIKALPSLVLTNTDNNGRPNVYDIDSDNDGITDNIEAQPTYSFLVATDADTDGDGLADVYDIYNGKGGNGITPYDHDSDGTPDYMDLDADNDSAPDRNEGSKAYSNLSQATINASGDTDGDGLMDYFDIFNVLSLSCGSVYKNFSMSNMGPLGDFNGPMPSGSNVQLVKSQLIGGDRDWRNVSVLSLQVLTFSGNLQSKIAHLNWKAEKESGVNHYEVERSFNGVQFEAIYKVAALNINNSSYTLNDTLIGKNFTTVYYRVRQKHNNAEERLTGTIQFKLDTKNTTTLTLYPNPATDKLTCTIRSFIKDEAHVTILNAAGVTVFHKTYKVENGENSFIIPEIKKFVNGIYMIKIKTSDQLVVERFIKQ